MVIELSRYCLQGIRWISTPFGVEANNTWISHLYDHTIILLRYQHDVVILSPVALRHAREFNLLACRLNHLLQHMLTFDISNCNQLGVLDVGLLELQQRFTINHPNAEWSSGGNIKIGFCRYGLCIIFHGLPNHIHVSKKYKWYSLYYFLDSLVPQYFSIGHLDRQTLRIYPSKRKSVGLDRQTGTFAILWLPTS